MTRNRLLTILLILILSVITTLSDDFDISAHLNKDTQWVDYQWDNKKKSRTFTNSRRIVIALSKKVNQPTLYNACKLGPIGTVNLRSCKYDKRLNNSTAKRITPDIEHISPASLVYKTLSCYNFTDKPRTDCLSYSDMYRNYYTDLHMLQPSLASINRDRGDRPYCGDAEGHDYGTGTIVDFDKDCITPSDKSKGIIARAMLYANDYYGLGLPLKEITLYHLWNASYPARTPEINRNLLIKGIQGNLNNYIPVS